ncbi:C39 family peptidase [Streptomyces sp. LX-29]|uniref:C39 family peptidase n=1 Tax=Streptomyces sp. LX-29 TaxID=2900152 RepID=UPI00240DD4A1|nr:C39 family peptidase [Streptomyces sp. LX-29]WFB09465.1 C39 family peptidase [Streptomyces sp. LX-29]
MTHAAPRPTVPYYSQWESADLVPEFVTGARSALDDPLWQKSGADSPEEYAFWAHRMCGVACLRMALDHWGLPVPPSVPLVRELEAAGAYVRDGDEVKGLIYQPFAEYVGARWGMRARSVPELTAGEIRRTVDAGGLVMISVHFSLRVLEPQPPARGGHLVLVVDADDDGVRLNNPSGLPGHSQEYAAVGWADLERFFAGRGVVLGAP